MSNTTKVVIDKATTIPGSDIIFINDNLSVVVDRKAEINIGDWYLSDLNSVLRRQANYDYTNCFKIIYSIGSEVLPGIKVIRVKSDEETESNKWPATDYLNSHNLERGKSFNLWKVIVRGAFALGFRAYKSKYIFTEWEVKMLLFKARSLTHQDESVDDLIQSALRPSIESLTITESSSGIIGEVKYRDK